MRSSANDCLGLQIFSSGGGYWQILTRNDARRYLPLKQLKYNLEEKTVFRGNFPNRVGKAMTCDLFSGCYLFRGS